MKKNVLIRKGWICVILVLFVSISTMPLAGSLFMQKQVSIEKSQTDCSIVKDSNLSLITVMYVGQGDGDYWYGINNNFTMTYQSDEIASMYYSLDGVWTEYNNPFVASEDGINHELEWYASNYEGNKSEVDGPFFFGIDQTPPEIEFTYEWSGNKPPYLFTYNVTARDGRSGMERVEFWISGELQKTFYGSGPYYVWSMYWVPPPKAILRAYAYDVAGNSAYDDILDPCNIEVLELPIFSTCIIGEQDSNQNSKSFVPITKFVGKVSELYSENPKSDCSMDDTFDIASLVVVVNRRMLNDYWVGSDVRITMFPDPDDITGVYHKLDDGEWILYTEPLVFSKDGYHRFWWYIVDDEGDISNPDSIVFNMDRTPPTINFSKEKIDENKTKFSTNVSDETSGVDRVEFYFDGFLVAKVTSPPFEWIYIGSGRHTLTAVVYDRVGNSNRSSLKTWHCKSDQQYISIPGIQSIMNDIPSTENKIKNSYACSFIKDAPNSSEQKILYETILYTFMGGFMGTGFYAFGPGNITRYREWEGYPYSFFSAGTWTNDGRWFCCLYNNGTLYEVNPKTFDAYAIGDGGDSLNGLAYDPVTEKMYGASSNILYEIDIETGEQEYRGFFGSDVVLMIAIAFDANGVLYGWDLGDKLWIIDTETGEATEVGPLGINLNYAQDGDFDKDEDILYLAAFTLSPGYGSFLYECDEDTGECTLVGTLGDGYIEIGVWTISYESNMEPPITTASFDPPYPDGCNGWYISNVTMTLNAIDNTGVIATYYRIDCGEWKEYNSVSTNITISEEGEHTIEYYSYDYIGNIEDVKSSTLYIDKTPPKTSLKWKVYSNKHGGWYVKFTVNATDAMSGMDRVEMYINDELHETITYPGPNYYFIINWSSEIKTAVFKFVAFDIAGNSVYKLINGSDIKSHPRNKSSTYQSVNLWLLRFLDRFPFFQRLLTLRGWINL